MIIVVKFQLVFDQYDVDGADDNAGKGGLMTMLTKVDGFFYKD